MLVIFNNSVNGFSQAKNPIKSSSSKNEKQTANRMEYFPREQIITSQCKSAKSSNECLNGYIETRVIEFLNTEVRRPKSKKDTLNVDVVFSVSEEGKVLKKRYEQMVQAYFLKEKQAKALRTILLELPLFEVYNRKPETYNVRHKFGYKLIFDKNGNSPYTVVKRESYEGGQVVEVPLFPGCERQTDALEKECFQRKMEEHISYHFNYPAEAMANGIEGRVDVMITIGKDGKVRDIKTRGPHYLLTQEAVRIMNQLPEMEPARIDGKPADIPYSVPVTFGLN